MNFNGSDTRSGAAAAAGTREQNGGELLQVGFRNFLTSGHVKVTVNSLLFQLLRLPPDQRPVLPVSTSRVGGSQAGICKLGLVLRQQWTGH